MTDNAKLKCINSDRALFKQFQNLVVRGEYLNAAVILASGCVEVYRYEEKEDRVLNLGSYNYTSESWHTISGLLDIIAEERKKKWEEQFGKLCLSVADGREWGLDLSHTDYAVLSVGSRSNNRRYKINWSREGLLEIMQFLAKTCNPQIDDE